MSQKVSVDARRRLVAQSLQVGNPGNNAHELSLQSEAPAVPCQLERQIELAVDEIRPYENNPRRSANVKFDDIKESIRASGLRSPLAVTQRPGESHFIVEAGGNTRLLALGQLWAETRDPRYRNLVVMFRPWRCESHVLTAHLIENEQRGEMSFWDKASGIVALKQRLELEQGRQLTLRPLQDALHAVGLAINTATLGLYLFATERLQILGDAVAGLTGLDVKTLQPRLNAVKRYASARLALSEEALYATVFEPVFRGIADRVPHSGGFNATATCEACEAAMAVQLGESLDGLRDNLRKAAVRGVQARPGASWNQGPDLPDLAVVAQLMRAEHPASAADDLSGLARAFAEICGLGHCVEPAPLSAAGFRLASNADPQAGSPERQRALGLLAGITGQVDRDSFAPMPLAANFLTWLADPADQSATAFWELLICLRQRNVPQGRMPTVGCRPLLEGPC
jgi:ParB family protein of integrating conjugative element (PFGI_1 class)